MSYADINHVVLIGRLTRDPELRALPSGRSVCGLRIACKGVRKDGDVYQERPHFFDVSAYGVQGENVDRYLSKGSRVAIAGRLEWREWETSDQNKRQAVSVVAESIQFLDTPGGAQRDGASDGEDDGSSEERELAGVGAGEAEGDLVF